MTFAEAALAYEMLQFGRSSRRVAAYLGVSRDRLSRIIKSCLDRGKDSPYLDPTTGHRQHVLTPAQVRHVTNLRSRKMTFKAIGAQMGIEVDRLRRAYRLATKHKDQPCT